MPCEHCNGTNGKHHERCPYAPTQLFCDICGARIDESEDYAYTNGVTICERCLKCTDDVEKVL
jgi:hypothetical protein